MATDYRRRAKRKKNKPVPAWSWFLAGLIVGLGLAGYGWYQCSLNGGSSMPPLILPVDQEDDQPAASNHEPDFIIPGSDGHDDLNLLRNEKPYRPAVPTSKPAARPDKPKDKPKTQQKDHRRYILQAGSFRTSAQADGIKASLALKGFSAKVHAAKANGKTWHRVQLGPYIGEAQAKKIRAQLSQQGIETLLKRVK